MSKMKKSKSKKVKYILKIICFTIALNQSIVWNRIGVAVNLNNYNIFMFKAAAFIILSSLVLSHSFPENKITF